MYAYEKTLLQTYHQTEAFIKSTQLAIKRGVRASYYSKKPTLDIAEEIIDLKIQLEEIREMQNAIDEALLELKPYYSHVLKARYEIGSGKGVQIKKDNAYYRTVAYSLGKFVAGMRKRGFTGEALKKLFQNYDYLQNAYGEISNFETKVKACGNLKNKGASLKDKKVNKRGFKSF